MQIRKLIKILGIEHYTVADYGDYFAIGGSLVHTLIKMDKKTKVISSTMDFDGKGVEYYEKGSDKRGYWEGLLALVASGEIDDILSKDDDIENPLPVYWIYKGALMEGITDKYGWPNITACGKLMYNNSHYATKEEALNSGIEDNEAGVGLWKRRLAELREEVLAKENRLEVCESRIFKFRGLLFELKKVVKRFEVDQQVTYVAHKGAKPEHGVVSTVKDQEDGSQKVWVRYTIGGTGALTPTDKLH